MRCVLVLLILANWNSLWDDRTRKRQRKGNKRLKVHVRSSQLTQLSKNSSKVVVQAGDGYLVRCVLLILGIVCGMVGQGREREGTRKGS